MFTLIATVIVACVSGFWLGQQIVGLFMKNRVDPRGKAVLVTGCDTGFGNVLAHRLHALGFTVFAGCLDSKGKGAVKLVEDAKRVELEGGSRGRMKVLQMDICKDEEVTEGVRTVSSLLPKDKGTITSKHLIRPTWNNNVPVIEFSGHFDIFDYRAQFVIFSCVPLWRSSPLSQI